MYDVYDVYGLILIELSSITIINRISKYYHDLCNDSNIFSITIININTY